MVKMGNLEKDIVDIRTIKEFLRQMVNQDPRGTAAPIYYTIRTSTYRVTADGEGDKTVIVVPDWDNQEIDLESEASDESESEKLFLEWCEYMDYQPTVELCESDEYSNFLKQVYTRSLEKVWEERNLFLTETDAENHLKSNYYHYSADAHTFVRHAWRAPELKNFFQALLRYFDIGSGISDYRL